MQHETGCMMLPHLPLSDPTAIVFAVLLIILLAPLLFERLRVPSIVGMIVAGIVVGPHGLGLLVRDQSFEIFGQVGLYYIMLLAGLTVDRSTLRGNLWHMLLAGLLSFAVPFAISGAVALWVLGMSISTAGLVACILASHTLVAWSIVSRYGLSRHRGAVLSLSATVISLFLALLFLGGIAASVQPSAGAGTKVLVWVLLVVKAVVFVAAMLLIYPRVIRWFFRSFFDEILQFIFVLVMTFLCAAAAEYVGLQGVLGAFLAGIMFARYIPATVPLMRHLDFVGNALFIPYFLIGVGMLINLPLVFGDRGSVWGIVIIVLIGLVGKAAGVLAAQWAIGFDRQARNLMIGLTSGHAAGALAMVMVGREVMLADNTLLANDLVLNASVLLILVSCIFSAVVTNTAARQIVQQQATTEEPPTDEDRLLVVLASERTMTEMVNLSLMMRPHRSVAPIVGVKLVIDEADGERARDAAREMVKQAARQMSVAGVGMKKVVRSGINFVTALSYTFKDFDASEILMAVTDRDDTDPEERRNTDMAQALAQAVNNQIVLLRLTQPLNTLRQIHVMVPREAELEVGFHRWLRHVCRLARALDCTVIFHCQNRLWLHIDEFCRVHYATVEALHQEFDGVLDFDSSKAGEHAFVCHLKAFVNYDHLIVFVLARQGSLSYQSGLGQIKDLTETMLVDHSTMLIYPDQYSTMPQSHIMS